MPPQPMTSSPFRGILGPVWKTLSKSAQWSFRSGRSLLAHVQSPKRHSYSNRNRTPTVMSCTVPCEQDHGPVDGEGDRHCSLDCSECLKRRIRLHGPPVAVLVSQRRRMLLVSSVGGLPLFRANQARLYHNQVPRKYPDQATASDSQTRRPKHRPLSAL